MDLEPPSGLPPVLPRLLQAAGAPEQATLLTEGVERRVAAADLAVGDRVLVRPGERIPAAGRVLAGAPEVHQASITGEPLPVDKAAGDGVFAGTGNGTGVLTVEVTRPARGNVVARIAAMAELLAHTGLRRGEALALQWLDVDLAKGVLRVRGT